MKFSRFQLAVIFITLFYSCETQNQKEGKTAGNQKLKISDSADSSFSKVEIHCWGFHSEAGYSIEDCGDVSGPLKTAGVIGGSRTLYRTIENSDTIKLLSDMIFSNKKFLEKPRYRTNAQFLILFKHDDMGADTIIYAGKEKLCFNDKLFFYYTFNIMDSIRYILGTRIIDCDCNLSARKPLQPQ